MDPTAMRNTAPPEREGLFFGYVTAVCVAAVVITALALPGLRQPAAGTSVRLLASGGVRDHR